MAARAALLVIDMQNDFCQPGGAMSVGGAMACVPRVVRAVELARSKGVPVVWIVREHDALGAKPPCGIPPPSVPERSSSPFPLFYFRLRVLTARRVGVDVEKFRAPLYAEGRGACVPGTHGVQLVDGLSVREGEFRVVKKRFSGFFGTNLDALLR